MIFGFGLWIALQNIGVLKSPEQVQKGAFMMYHLNNAPSTRGKRVILGGAVTWRRGFVNNFLRVPIACLVSRVAAVKLCNSQKIVYKTSSPSNSHS